MMNARFWVMVNGASPVKLKLRDGEVIEHYQSRRTDEGWAGQGVEFRREGELIFATWAREGRDCDGRYCDVDERVTSTLELRAGYQDESNPGVVYPRWHSTSDAEVWALSSGARFAAQAGGVE